MTSTSKCACFPRTRHASEQAFLACVSVCSEHKGWREKGKIVHARLDDDRVYTASVMIEFEGGSVQGLSPLALDGPTGRWTRGYIAALYDTFGHAFNPKSASDTLLKRLVGEECYALRSFLGWNSLIEGVESATTHKRFVSRAWAAAFAGKQMTSALDARAEELQARIRNGRRMIADAEAALDRLTETYLSWT